MQRLHISPSFVLPLILLVSLLLRIIGLLPNIPHPDEGYILDTSQNLLINLVEKTELNPNSFKYGTPIFYLHALLSFPFVAIGYFSQVIEQREILDFSIYARDHFRINHIFYLGLGRLTGVVSGSLSVLLVYKIASLMFNKKTGLFSAGILAVSPFHTRDSHYLTVDILSTFLILLAFYLSLGIHKTKNIRHHFIVGLVVAIASFVRLFPVALIAYGPIFLWCLLKKRLDWKAAVASFAGFLIGMFLTFPFLFIDSDGPRLFKEQLEWFSNWYGTSISAYVFSVLDYIGNKGQRDLPSISSLKPDHYYPYFLSFIAFNGLGAIAAVLSLAGVIFGAVKKTRAIILTAVVPLITLIYASFYLPSTYERTVLPALPFLCIFAGIGMTYVFNARNILLRHTGIFLLGLGFLIPFASSAQASISCGEESLQEKAASWININIPKDSKIAYTSPLSMPAWVQNENLIPLNPNNIISLEEAKSLGANYIALNTGTFEYVTYPYFNEFFIPSAELYLNSYPSLVLEEYKQRSKQTGSVKKHRMCESGRIAFYSVINEGKDSSFNRIWSQENIIYKERTANLYPSPQLVTVSEVKTNTVYKISARVKNTGTNTGTLIIRLDFETDNAGTLSKIKRILSLLTNGPSQRYFEETNNSIYPSLSPKADGVEVNEITFVVKSPENAKSGTIYIQGTKSGNTEFLVEDLRLEEGLD